MLPLMYAENVNKMCRKYKFANDNVNNHLYWYVSYKIHNGGVTIWTTQRTELQKKSQQWRLNKNQRGGLLHT